MELNERLRRSQIDRLVSKISKASAYPLLILGESLESFECNSNVFLTHLDHRDSCDLRHGSRLDLQITTLDNRMPNMQLRDMIARFVLDLVPLPRPLCWYRSLKSAKSPGKPPRENVAGSRPGAQLGDPPRELVGMLASSLALFDFWKHDRLISGRTAGGCLYATYIALVVGRQPLPQLVRDDHPLISMSASSGTIIATSITTVR